MADNVASKGLIFFEIPKKYWNIVFPLRNGEKF